MKPAPAALLAVAVAASRGVGVVTADELVDDSAGRGLQATQNSAPFAHFPECVPDPALGCDLASGLTLGAGPLNVPCGSCLKVDVTGDITIPGIDVHGLVIFEDDGTYVNITTPYVFVQGQMDIQVNKEVTPSNKRVTFTLSGTDSQTMVPNTGGFTGTPNTCVSDGCTFGKKPFVVAGGKMNVDAFPATSQSGTECPTWTKLEVAEAGGGASLPSDQYDSVIPTNPVDVACDGGHVFDHYFSGTDNTWTQGEGNEAGATCAMDNATSSMTVKDRVKTYQGPTIDITHRTGCILPDVDYLFTARVKIDKEGVDGTPTSCKSSNSDCLKLENWIQYNDMTEYEGSPAWAKQTKGSAPNYGEWSDFTATLRFTLEDLTDVHFNALVLSGPSAGDSISMQHARLTLPDVTSYHPDNCNELVLNGNAAGNGIHPHPVISANSGSRILVVDEGQGKFYKMVDRVNKWDTPKFPVNKHCAVGNQVYRVSAYVRIHSTTPASLKFELRKYTDVANNQYADYLLADCPAQSASDGFVLCQADVTLNENTGGGEEYHLRYEINDMGSGNDALERMDVDLKDFSVAFQEGPVKSVVIPEDVRGCWGAGSELLVTSHTLSWNTHQVAVIESVEESSPGKTRINLVESIVPPTDRTGPHPEMAAEVALLTRNVGIRGAYDDPTPEMGGTFAIYHTPSVVQKVDGIEFVNMGQSNLKYKWAVAVTGTSSIPGSSVSKNSIVDSNHRCITLQNANEVTVAGNVGYKHRGHCYVTNDGGETDNVFRKNLGAYTRRGQSDLTYGPHNLEDKDYVSTYFMRGPRNYYEDNVAAGSESRGWLFMIKNSIGDVSSGVGGNPRKYVWRSFKNNVIHSNAYAGVEMRDFTRDQKSQHAYMENVHAYRNKDIGVRFYYTYNTGILGGFFADNDRSIDVYRSVGITPINDAVFYGETSTQRDLVAKQSAVAMSCGSSDPAAGIRMITYKRSNGYEESSEMTNLHFADFDTMSSNCGDNAKRSPIYLRKDESYGRFNWATSTTNVTVSDNRGPQFMYACQVRDEKDIDQVSFWDYDNSLNPDPTSTFPGPSILVSDNDKMKAFANGPCRSMPGCVAHCEDVCPRTVTFFVSLAETEDWTLEVTDGQGRTASFDGKIRWTGANSQALYSYHRSFSASLPAGTYTAVFKNGSGDVAWPTFVEEIWSPPPTGCSAHANVGDVTVTVPDPAEGECSDLAFGGTVEDFAPLASNPETSPPGGFKWWQRTNSNLRIVTEDDGSGNPSNMAVEIYNRGDDDHGIGQYLDMRCVRDLQFYDDSPAAPYRYRQFEFTARIKLKNKSTGLPETCDPDESSKDLGCPELTLRHWYYKNGGAAAKVELGGSEETAFAEVVRPYQEGDVWNTVHGVFAIDLYRGVTMVDKPAIFWYLDNFHKNKNLIVDDVSFKPADDTCDDLVRNGKFADGTAKYWDTYSQDTHTRLRMVQGIDGPGDYALEAWDRKNSNSRTMSQYLKLGCMRDGEYYVFRAKYQIREKTMDGTGAYHACLPDWTSSTYVADHCPEARLRADLRGGGTTYGTDKTNYGNINLGNPVWPTVASADGWNSIVGFYRATAHEEKSEELRLYFERLRWDMYDLILDDVSMTPHPLQCDANLILNSGFEGGDAEFWSFRDKNRGKLDVVPTDGAPGSGGTYAARVYERTDWDDSVIHHRLDSRCFQEGQIWEINAKFKLLNSTGGAQDCVYVSGDSERCPEVMVYGRVCDGLTTSQQLKATLPNSPPDGNPTWNMEEFNPFFATFSVDAQMASCLDIHVELAAVKSGWDLLIDDVSVTLKTAAPTAGPTDAPTKAPTTAAPTMDGTGAPTPSPSSSPSMVATLLPLPGAKSNVDAGPLSLAIAPSEQLCTLTRVEGDAVVPVARSYEGIGWNTAAGEVAASLVGDQQWTCYLEACEIDLPPLGAGQSYVLTTYNHSLDSRDEVARFLERTTFGTTAVDLDAWNYAAPDTEAEMASYVATQMDATQTAPSSHREFWRRRANPRYTFPQAVAAPDHPCSPGSRWRRAAFTNKDDDRNNWEHYMTVRATTDNSGNDKFILGVDGADRTAVSEFKFVHDDYVNYTFDDPDFQYELCRVDDGLGDDLRITALNPVTGSWSCQAIQGGNPHINWDDFNDPPRLVPLPNIGANLKLIDTDQQNGAELFILENGLDDPACGTIGVIDYRDPPAVGKTVDGTWLAFDPRVDLHDNVPTSPLTDGGGSTELATAGATLCSNAPRTFLNFEQCKLSTDATACGDVPAPPTEIVLNDENIKKIHELTGQYVYGLKGLVVKQINANTSQVTYEEEHPCIDGRRSRWLKSPGKACPDPTPLGPATLDVLTAQIIKWSEEQQNPVITDVYFPKSGTSCDPADTDPEIQIEIAGDCYAHVHRDYLSVYDMTYWTLEYTHPGNAHAVHMGHYNPIKKWMDLANSSTLTFPSTYPDHPFGHLEGNHSDHHGHGDGGDMGMNDTNHTMPMRRRTDKTMMDPMDMMMGHDVHDGHSHDHPMTRWDMHKVKFTYVGRMYDTVYFRDLPNELRLDEVAEFYGATGDVQGAGVLVCGSPGEVENDPATGDNGFDVKAGNDFETTGSSFMKRQKEITWTMVTLRAQDQLRQRMAWALSQILVVVPGALADEGEEHTEMFLNYYDIFVRNAFGNYRDVLKEISYSPMMAENLSYLQSKSHAYMREKYGQLAFADENFAREIMQLFTVGLFELNDDGTLVYDENGKKVLTYSNEDIMNFARGWTGFDYQKKRGNSEERARSRNRLDPMKIDATWRDKFPKRDLDGGYIGDRYPLCVDLPSDMFLKKGAKYRLLGSTSLPEKMWSDPKYLDDDTILKFELGSDSDLKGRLCQNAGANCLTPTENVITLDNDIDCKGEECNVDTVRVVQVSAVPNDLYYEYVRPPCVELAFYSDAKKLSKRKKSDEGTMCANPLLPVAQEACCTNPLSLGDKTAVMDRRYDGERVTYQTASTRCSALNAGYGMCDYDKIDTDLYSSHKTGYHWTESGTDNKCFIDVKVDDDGWIAIVYRMNAMTSKVMHVDDDSLNFFPVAWEGDYPNSDGSGCGACQALQEGGCRCETTVGESVVFNGIVPSSVDDALAKLFIGSVNVTDLTGYTAEPDISTGIIVHKKNAGIDSEAVFEVFEPLTGRTFFLKNVQSTVSVTGTPYTFRNSPHFMSMVPTMTDVRDAEYETDAILDHYFYRSNTAPFLAIRFIQRFGISNPTPAFVTAVADAFRSGEYTTSTGGHTFGTGVYGDLEATSAAVLLHPESRSVVLDADPSHGALREPLMKIVAYMRNLDYVPAGDDNDLITFKNGPGLEDRIGQMAHWYPTVFSFFLPEYVPSGRCTSAGKMVSPEAMMIDMPKIIATLNGLFSMSKYGLEDKNEGFGQNGSPSGYLEYSKTDTTANIVDDLATLMTSGRLSSENRATVVAAHDQAVSDNAGDAAKGLDMAQQLIASSAEFHSTNIVKKAADPARTSESASAGGAASDYKSVVFLMFAGGCDSYNMLVPHSQCLRVGNETDLWERYVEIRQQVALEQQTLRQINATGSGQDCDVFGLHPELSSLQSLYADGDALFVANAGVLTKPTDKANYRQDTVTNLFAHNTMQEEGKRVDPFEEFAGSGVMGRLTDVLHAKNYRTSAISIDSSSVAVVGQPGESPSPNIISKNGLKEFNKDPTTTEEHMRTAIESINSATVADSGFMAETWSANLVQSLASNEELAAALASASTNVTFPSSDLGDKFEMVTKLMQTSSTRGIDRDFFYVSMGGYDTHSQMKDNLMGRFQQVNPAVQAFSDELKAQGLWDRTVLIEVSDFARTLTPNSGDGTDHAWGGNYFVLGGQVKGGQILGKYPSDIRDGAPLNVGRGRIIPTTSWDHLWNGVAQWVGVTAEEDLEVVLPNRANFDDLFSESDMFVTGGGDARERERFLRDSAQ